MNKQTMCIAIGNQKGGIGKTTTTMLTASILNAATKYKICVIDIDPQYSCDKKRKKELEAIETKSDPRLLRGYNSLLENGKGLYDVLAFDLLPTGKNAMETALMKEQVFSEIEAVVQSGKYDMIFFDFPGYISQIEYLKVLRMMNYVIIPFYLDDNSTDSTLEYINTVQYIRNQKLTALKDYAIFFWKYSKVKNKEANLLAVEQLRKKGMRVFDSKVYESTEFEQNRSTVIPFDIKGEKSLTAFVKELVGFIREKELVNTSN